MRSILTLLLPAALTCLASAQTTGDPTVGDAEELARDRARFVELAGEVPGIDVWSILHGGEVVPVPAMLLEPAERRALDEMSRVGRRLGREELIALAGSSDPGVRSLALANLAGCMEPADLPFVRSMLDDREPGLASMNPVSIPFLVDVDADHPEQVELRANLREAMFSEPKPVGEVAGAILGVYLSAAGFHDVRRDWETYWNARSDRSTCLSWLRVELLRATGGVTPFLEERAPRVAALRERIEALPAPERDLMLVLLARPDEHPLVDRDRWRAAARSLGPERLMALLRCELGDLDPDLVPPQDDWRMARTLVELLDIAHELLPAEAADELLGLEQAHRRRVRDGRFGVPSSAWAVAAARLRPDRAREILLEGLSRFTDPWPDGQTERARLALELWRQCGDGEAPLVLDWFFGETPRPRSMGFGRHQFVDWMGAEDAPLVESVLRDPRLDGLDPWTLRKLVYAMPRVLDREVLAGTDIRRLDPAVLSEALREGRPR